MWSIISWVFSVMVSFLVNVASTYAIPYIDKYWEQWSDYRRITNEKKRAEIDKEVAKMLDDRDYFQYKLAQSNNSIVNTFHSVLFLISTLVSPILIHHWKN